MVPTTTRIPVRFSGTANEYFGIWIVNVALSIVTFGVYSAWAKVRNRKYFLGNTTIDGRPFDYHARGEQILVGRAIVVALFVVYSVTSSLSPIAGWVAFPLLMTALPWLINRGLRFNAAMTSWSNVRFRFEGTYWAAFRVFQLYPFLMVYTLFLALPFVTRAVGRYRIGRHQLGGHRFAFDSGIGPFYAAFAVAALWMALGLALAFAIASSLMRTFEANRTGGDMPESSAGAFLTFLMILFLTALPIGTIYRAFTRNAIFAGIELEGGHRFESTVWPPMLVWIAISNSFVILVSVGMLVPWARIRLARYLCANTLVRPAGSPDEFVGEAERRQSAIGDAYMDIDGIDAGAGF